MRILFHSGDGRTVRVRFDLRDKIEELAPCIAFNLGMPTNKKYGVFNITGGYFSAAVVWGDLVPTCEYRLYPIRD